MEFILTNSLQKGFGGGIYVENGDLSMTGCMFSGNEAWSGNDIHLLSGSIEVSGCPAGSSGAAGAALDITKNGGTINGEAKSYSCDPCAR